MRTLLAGRYRLLEPIGTGGTATVWRAWDVRDRRAVALKRLPSYAAGSPHKGDPGSLLPADHPHLVVPRATVAAARPVLVMDLVRGGTADQLLTEHGALPADFVAVLLDQLLQALDAVHRCGLVHRDVAPANLLLEPTGAGRPHLRLADFGAAAAAAARPPEIVGTDGYLAPEVFVGAPADPRQDLFAAGVTAYELLTGRLPPPRGLLADAPGTAPLAPLRWPTRRSLRPHDRIPTPLRALVDQLTQPVPDRRPPAAAAARAALQRAGVPDGAPWARRPDPPVVPDRIGDTGRSEWLRLRWAHRR